MRGRGVGRKGGSNGRTEEGQQEGRKRQEKKRETEREQEQQMEGQESARERGSLRFTAITRVADRNSRPSYPLDTACMNGSSETYIHARHTSSESYLAVSAEGLDPWLVLRRWYDEHTVACCSCRECERETDTHS